MKGERQKFGKQKAESRNAGGAPGRSEPDGRGAPCRERSGGALGDEFVTKKELAARLKVAVRTIEQWQHDGLLPYLKIANVILFHWPEVVEHLKANFKVCPNGVVWPGSDAETGTTEQQRTDNRRQTTGHGQGTDGEKPKGGGRWGASRTCHQRRKAAQ